MATKEEPAHINVDYFSELTGDLDQCAAPSVEDIGQRLKSLREEKGLTLDGLASATGFDVGLLSDIETDQVKPQLGTIMRLSRALESAFGKVIFGGGDRSYAITRKADRKSVSRSDDEHGHRHVYSYTSLAPDVFGRHMEALLVQLQENPEPESSIHDGEEFIFVLDGTVTFTICGETHELGPGDSIYYMSRSPHVLAAKAGTGTASILAVLYDR